MSKVQQLLNAFKLNAKSNKELIAAARKSINEAVQAIFDDNPKVNVIAVEGYTPHFNDGDVCEWGINVGVDWLHDCYHTPAYQKESNLLSIPLDKAPASWSKEAKKQPDYDELEKARKLLEHYSSDFEILDNDQNGTWWVFVRDGNSFKIESGHFEHD